MREFVPRLRQDLQITPTTYQGRRALLVRDCLGIIQNSVILQGEALSIIGLIDGRRNVTDIKLDFIRLRGGVLVEADFVESFLSELDAALLLDGPKYRLGKETLIASYLREPVQKASHAGLSYPSDPAQLKVYLSSILELARGRPFPALDGAIRALVSPHIDLETGKAIYGQVYQAASGLRPQRVLLLGTGHSLEEGLMSLTEKDFETPLGLVRTDKDFVKKLKSSGGPGVTPHDLAFRQEHSLEFQLIFLQHLFGSDFTLVPVLFGSFQPLLNRARRPQEILGLAERLSLLGEFAEREPGRTLAVVGVDFSHIGPKFGHPERASSLLLEAKEHDRRLIGACLRGDAEGFWTESKKVGDRYNVCGFSSLACLLEILPGAKGYLLDYAFWQEEETQSAVSFAGIVFTK